jgi:fatty acid desaturase
MLAANPETAADFKARLHAMHHIGWWGTWIWLGFLIAILALEGLLVAFLLRGPTSFGDIALVVLLVLTIAHLMHSHLIALHEAAHGLLCPIAGINDAIGKLLGSLSFMSFELYRAAHHTHHAYLATERDEELWPFVLPQAPRWARCISAGLELSCGLLYTPLLFLRAFFRRGTLIVKPAVRKRVHVELAVIAILWSLQLAAIAWWDLWLFWLLMYLTPAWLAGCWQSLRKYIEHMGVTGSTALSATRSVRPAGWLGRLLAFTLFNEPLHGIHHKYPRLPQEALPAFSAILTPSQPGEMPPFRNYRSAFWSMLVSLGDPRIGKSWRNSAGSPS